MQANQIANMVWSEATGTNDCTDNQYRAVKLNSQGAAPVTAVTDNVVGFQQNAPTAINQSVSIESNGITLAVADGVVTKGLQVAISAAGGVVNAAQTITIAGTVVEGDVYAAVVNGTSYAFTALATPTATSVAAGLAALINAASGIAATSALGVITVTPSSASVTISKVVTDSTAGTITIDAKPTIVGNALASAVANDIFSIKLKNM